MVCVGTSAVHNMAEFVSQHSPHSPSQEDFAECAAARFGRAQRAADVVALDFGERNHLAIHEMRISEGGRFVGKVRRLGGNLATPMESHDYDALKGIRGGKVVQLAPVQFKSGVLHQRLEFSLHFADRPLRMPAVKLKNNRHTCRGEGGACRRK